MFSSWQNDIQTFLGVSAYPNFIPVSYAKQIVNGTNYKVVYKVSADESNIEHLIVIVFVPLPVKGTDGKTTAQQPQILNVVLPNGQTHGAENNSTDATCSQKMLGAQSCWKTDIDSAMKTKFVGY